jgi:hypothetical protein
MTLELEAVKASASASYIIRKAFMQPKPVSLRIRVGEAY